MTRTRIKEKIILADNSGNGVNILWVLVNGDNASETEKGIKRSWWPWQLEIQIFYPCLRLPIYRELNFSPGPQFIWINFRFGIALTCLHFDVRDVYIDVNDRWSLLILVKERWLEFNGRGWSLPHILLPGFLLVSIRNLDEIGFSLIIEFERWIR